MVTMDHFYSLQNYWTDPEWLRNRMLFLSGPRQVGKTTLVQNTLCGESGSYFNWDNPKIRRAYREDSDFFSSSTSPWICFDEIHKRPQWKNILKGAYDTFKDKFRFVITGSARLEVFKKSGDSLVGRYFNTHLFPLNLGDFRKKDFSQLPENPMDLLEKAASTKDTPDLEPLLSLSGFPEPFFSGSESFWKRWSKQHQELIITEDLRDLTRIVNFDKLEHFLKMMGPSIGQTISHLHFANDLETTHGTIKRWLQELNKVQLLFPVPPYSKKIRKAYRLEKKWYFMDWRAAGGDKLFENYVASTLHRAVTLYSDRFGEDLALYFIRTHDGAEVDFMITRNDVPWLLIEAKEGKPDPTRAVYRFSNELHVPCVIVTRKAGIAKKNKESGRQPILSLSMNRLSQVLP